MHTASVITHIYYNDCVSYAQGTQGLLQNNNHNTKSSQRGVATAIVCTYMNMEMAVALVYLISDIAICACMQIGPRMYVHVCRLKNNTYTLLHVHIQYMYSSLLWGFNVLPRPRGLRRQGALCLTKG